MKDIKTDESKMNGEMQGNLMAPMNNKSIVGRIITRITNAIISGELKPGQRIPTESELCESMQVSRNSVREAVKALVAMGVLDIRRAEGTFVVEGFSDRMLDPMVYGLILEGGNSPAIIELRKLFEVGTLKLAIEKATDEDIKRMQEALETLRIKIVKRSDKEEILDADIRFHKALEQAVNNPLVDKISVVIERLSRLTRARAIEHFIKENKMDELFEMHEKMLNLIIESNEASVAEVLDEHFKYWKNELK